MQTEYGRVHGKIKQLIRDKYKHGDYWDIKQWETYHAKLEQLEDQLTNLIN